MTPAERITQAEREKLTTVVRIKARGFLSLEPLDEDIAVLTARILCTHANLQSKAGANGRHFCPDCGGTSR